MTVHVLRLPFALDPLIGEARRRMRRRRFGLVGVLLAATGLTLGLAFAFRSGGPEAPRGVAQTAYRLDWRTTMKVDGRVAFRTTVYWISVSESQWAVRASVVNVSGHTLRPLSGSDSGWGVEAVTAGQRAHPTQCTGRTCFTSRASSFRPALPDSLPSGARWTGVFSGTGEVPHSRWASLGLGYYIGWTRLGFGIDSSRAVHIR